MIEELPRLPVNLHRYMGAAVEIGMHLPAKSHDEGGFADTASFDGKAHAASAVHQCVAGADRAAGQACRRSHAVSSATLPAQ